MASSRFCTYTARMCWNDRGWVEPAGVAASAESESFANKGGYGHEEWLFSSAFEWDGWRYGFLEPVSRSRKRLLKDGETAIRVLLWTKDPSGNRWYVGEIDDCRVLDDEVIRAASKHFRSIGLTRRMDAQIRSLRLGTTLDHDWLFNIRFRSERLTLYDPFRRVGKADAVNRLGRYALVFDDGKFVRQWRRRRGQTAAKELRERTRAATDTTAVGCEHDRLQNQLLAELHRRYGLESTIMEQDWIDLQCLSRGSLHLFEVKSDARPMACIRQSLGQLLEYAYRVQTGLAASTVLHVCGPGQLDEEGLQYMNHLRKALMIPVFYHQVHDKMDLRTLMQDG